MNKKAVLISMIWSASTFAQVQKIDLQKDLPSRNAVDLYDFSKDKKNIKLSPLSQLKQHEIQLNWSACLKLAPQVYQSQKEIRGWVALTWLHCLEQGQKKQDQSRAIENALAVIETDASLKEGPWVKEINRIRISFVLSQLEKQITKKSKKAATSLDFLLNEPSVLNAEQKSKAYELLGDLALGRSAHDEAKFLYEQAQNQKNSRALQEKIDRAAKALGKLAVIKESSIANTSVSEEAKLEEHMRQSIKQNNLIAALKDALSVLNRFSGSRTAKNLKDKPLEIYNSISDKGSKQAALNEMGEADGVRLLEWAQSLHRRGDYSGAFFLAQKMAEKNPRSPNVTSALWIAGRSAHFMGQYERALEYFNMLTQFHNGSEESAEALFRSGIICYRKKDFLAAVAHFEKLSQLNIVKYDLSSKYWLTRALQETEPERAKKFSAALIEKYPFSYYGLRLRAESQDGKISWPEISGTIPKLEHELYLVGAQKKSWKRFKILSDAGWVQEAQIEIANRPFIKDPTLKMVLAQKMAERHQYPIAIRLLNEAMESDVRLRREQFVKIGYPSIYSALYRIEAEKYKIPAALLRSLTRQESAFNIQAVSTSNAMGLMQMIPPTAQEISKKLGLKIEIPNDMFRPQVNIPMGSFYVAQMLEQFQGNVPFALAAYNAGPHRLKNWLESRPEVKDLVSQMNGSVQNEIWFDELPWTETSFYVKAILRNILLYRLVEEGAFTLNPVLWADSNNKKSE